ncbi:MAG: TonB-dependent receptor plug domain-containing protein [Candidatus Acidiferrales bacterium]
MNEIEAVSKSSAGAIAAGVVAFFILGCTIARAQAPGSPIASTTPPGTSASVQPDLTNLSIEDLMKVEVTSASKKAETLSKAPAAIYVITGDDIRRGGFSSVPDALRSVPGLYVVQQSAHVWLVSARGFSSTFNDRMLVLIDGRVVYSPTFGGVYWDVQDPPLEDIDRIEVIRGPGGTLWGANAVNGVINIITKEAAKTQGPQVTTSGGANEGYAGRVRYGGSAGDNFAYRVYGTSNYWLPTVDAAGADNYDAWTISQGGMRFDWNLSSKDIVTFDGEGYSGRVRDVVSVFSPTSAPVALATDTVVKGGHVLARWKHTSSERSSTEVLGFCDWTERIAAIDTGYRSTCDVELQHDYTFSARQTLTMGGGILTTADTWPASFTISFVPASQRDTTYSGFIQYDVSLVPDKLRVIAGSKFEHNDYTGFEYQPQIRAVWTPNSSNTLWGAYSRAVRTPAEIEEGLRDREFEISEMPPTFVLVEGHPGMESEILHAAELGYRYEWKPKFSVDAAIYYNSYSRLLGLSAPGAAIVNPSPLYVDLPVSLYNPGGAQTHGLELSLNYAPVRRWTLSAAITEVRGTSIANAGFPAVAANPEHQLNVQSRFDLTRHLNFDAAYYYYDAIHDALPTVNRVDVGVSTNNIRGFTYSVWGRNLQQDRHVEAIPYSQILLSGEIRRSVVFKITWESGRD